MLTFDWIVFRNTLTVFQHDVLVSLKGEKGREGQQFGL